MCVFYVNVRQSTMKIKDIPTPSALLSNVYAVCDRLSTSTTDMAAPLDHEEELWPQFEVSVQSVTEAFKKYARFEIHSSSSGSRLQPD